MPPSFKRFLVHGILADRACDAKPNKAPTSFLPGAANRHQPTVARAQTHVGDRENKSGRTGKAVGVTSSGPAGQPQTSAQTRRHVESDKPAHRKASDSHQLVTWRRRGALREKRDTRNGHPQAHPHTLLRPKQSCEGEELLLQNRCPRGRGMESAAGSERLLLGRVGGTLTIQYLWVQAVEHTCASIRTARFTHSPTALKTSRAAPQLPRKPACGGDGLCPTTHRCIDTIVNLRPDKHVPTHPDTQPVLRLAKRCQACPSRPPRAARAYGPGLRADVARHAPGMAHRPTPWPMPQVMFGKRIISKGGQWAGQGSCKGVPPPPLSDIPSGCCSFTALDSHPLFPSHVASGRCVLSAAAAGALAGVVSAFAEPSSWCVGTVLNVAWCAVCASTAPNSWRIEDVLVVAGVI